MSTLKVFLIAFGVVFGVVVFIFVMGTGAWLVAKAVGDIGGFLFMGLMLSLAAASIIATIHYFEDR